jgi:transcription-repair coupling factor (superfamily II helicase)
LPDAPSNSSGAALAERLRALPGWRNLVTPWRAARGPGLFRWGGFWGSAKALASAALAREHDSPLLVVTADSAAAELAVDDLHSFGCGAALFPARESSLGAEADVLRGRHHALALLGRAGFGGTVVAPIAALIQPVPEARDADAALELSSGTRLDPEALARRLLAAGFERVPAISEPGEFARRGDILDFFAPALGEPLRCEFYGDEMESVRVFDLATQRTRHVLKHVSVPLGRDLPEAALASDALPLERMPPDLRVAIWEPAAVADAHRRLRFLGEHAVAALARLDKLFAARVVVELATLPGADATYSTLSVEEYCRGVAPGAALLAERAAAGERAVVFCATAAEADRLRQILRDAGHPEDRLLLHEGSLERGFRAPEARLTVLHHREFVPGHGAQRPRARRRREHASETLQNAIALKPGDLVVHAVQGLARFRGMDSASAGGAQDVLILEFADGALLQVPASRVDLVERYIGAGGTTPQLDRLGGGAFLRRRKKVEEAVEDLAAAMLEVQAKREALPGTEIPPPGKEQAEFEDAFLWDDTPDQAQGTREIHADLSLPRAMDRLLCGDVGFGKTELAARAAFRVIHDGRQVAILVPTTVLAEQHARSLRERFADWPVEIGVLSRLAKPAERRKTLQGLAEGGVDIVVGTHRLLSPDVAFKNLGLVVIDEEQRFGVRHKEDLKRRRAQVDMLTLTATPIPRTLHQALAGIRDITSLSTAPAGRQEVHTEIRYRDEDALVKEAVERELARGGQVFFVHNRVRSLQAAADRIKRLVPRARIALGHGRMEPVALEDAMIGFVRGEVDVLCSTTIIESGLDIPNANTIFIDDAQRFGLADLHQLRGRVGRSARRGWCYLLIPRHQPLPLDARRRLKAIEEMRYLGAGFQLALRDLEIRGAGNLLGAEQSGHIHAVGYETYRRLLAQAVARLRRREEVVRSGLEPACDVSLGVAAALSPGYVPEEETRMQVLRELDRVRTPAELDSLLEALRDRFGPPPAECVALARLFFLKHRLGALGLDALQRVDDHLSCAIRDARAFAQAMRPLRADLRVLSPRRALWMLPRGVRSADEALELVLETLGGCTPAPPRRKSGSGARPRP